VRGTSVSALAPTAWSAPPGRMAAGGESLVQPNIWLILWPVFLLIVLVLIVLAVVLLVRRVRRGRRHEG
jgi:uncharacterized membrane protein